VFDVYFPGLCNKKCYLNLQRGLAQIYYRGLCETGIPISCISEMTCGRDVVGTFRPFDNTCLTFIFVGIPMLCSVGHWNTRTGGCRTRVAHVETLGTREDGCKFIIMFWQLLCKSHFITNVFQRCKSCCPKLSNTLSTTKVAFLIHSISKSN
jgi:hypothetical protein